MTIKLGDKEVTIKELKRKDVRGHLTGLEGEEIQDVMLSLATDLTSEEIDELSLGEYLKLSLEFNKVNNISVEDFPKPQEK